MHHFGEFTWKPEAGRGDKRETKKRSLEKEKNYNIRSLQYQKVKSQGDANMEKDSSKGKKNE